MVIFHSLLYVYQKVTGWWLAYPSEKYESQLGWLFPIYGQIKFMFPNHQPGIISKSAGIIYIYILENDVYHCKVLIVSKKNIKMILSWLVSMYPNYSQLIAKGNSPETLNP